MLPLEKIREDLRDIRYYYARKEIFDSAIRTVGINDIIAKAEKYNKAARNAPPRMLDLYISLYLKNQTQASLANDIGMCTEHLRREHTKLVKFLQTQITE